MLREGTMDDMCFSMFYASIRCRQFINCYSQALFFNWYSHQNSRKLTHYRSWSAESICLPDWKSRDVLIPQSFFLFLPFHVVSPFASRFNVLAPMGFWRQSPLWSYFMENCRGRVVMLFQREGKLSSFFQLWIVEQVAI